MSRKPFVPDSRFTKLFPDVSGNTVNGLGETEIRRPSPFFWHPPSKHKFGALQKEVIDYQRVSPAIREHFSHEAPRGPKPVERAPVEVQRPAEEWSSQIKAFALAHEGDLVGITPMSEAYLYEGYELPHRWLIMIGVSMDHDELSQAPSTYENPAAAVEVARQYNRASRVCRELCNHILAQGFEAMPWPGPFASALNMVPAAIAAGLGQLGKHGSMINRTWGSSFRLSAVSTDMPLVADGRDDFGSEDFCTSCQICTKACPPGALSDDKSMVRGVEKWYVDFDKCIPYFGEAMGCAICLAVCPWSKPGTAPRLAEKMLKRRERKSQA